MQPMEQPVYTHPAPVEQQMYAQQQAQQEVSMPEEIPLANPSLQMVNQAMQRPSTPDSVPGEISATDSCSESTSEVTDSAGASGTGTAMEKRLARRPTNKRRRTTERGPRLTVLSIQGSMVECQLEALKQKTVTFKFDRTDTVPAEVARNLILHNFLGDQHMEIFVEQVRHFRLNLRPKRNFAKFAFEDATNCQVLDTVCSF